MGVEQAVMEPWAGAACLSLVVLTFRIFILGKSG